MQKPVSEEPTLLSMAKDSWQVYVIETSDAKLYTGITTDITQRWQQHQSGKGAKFFRGRKPQRLCYLEFYANRSAASRREAEIKKMTRQQKLLLIASSPVTRS
jgi:putative endonuclease